MNNFDTMGLSPEILNGIKDLGFITPTPIQEKVIPIVFESNHDIVGLAQTGTGKTAAFGLPIIERINVNDKSTSALILSPTRELCIQITNDMQNFAKYKKGLNIVAVYGGARIDSQIKAIKAGAHIVVATPGRMNDLLNRKTANLSKVATVVLDEADEMLNMGFRDELDAILEKTPAEKRTLLFSATMSKEVARIAGNYMKDPVEVRVGKQNSGADNVRHLFYQVHAKDRYLALKRIADFNPDIYGIVFCRTRQETKDVAEKLIKDGYNADALHGDLSQVQRDQVMKRFRERSLQMLVATDVAARGLDVSDISHIINYNLPEDVEIYTHRSGRTGRADKSGISIAIVNYREKSKIPMIEKSLGKRFVKAPVPKGDEICEKQLYNLIDRMEKVEINEDQIEPFIERINKKLDWLSKEEIVKRFVALEFNRFLDYYKDAPDLNEKDEPREGRRGRKESFGRGDRERSGRGDRDRSSRGDRDRSSRGDRDRSSYGDRDNSSRGERDRSSYGERDNSGRGERRDRKSSRGKFSKIFINIGKKDGVQPINIIGLINDKTGDRDINVGEIEIKDSFSFFEVDSQHGTKVINSLENNSYKGRALRVEFSGDVPPAAGNASSGAPKFGKKRKKK